MSAPRSPVMDDAVTFTYRKPSSERTVETVARLRTRIHERFPASGLRASEHRGRTSRNACNRSLSVQIGVVFAANIDVFGTQKAKIHRPCIPEGPSPITLPNGPTCTVNAEFDSDRFNTGPRAYGHRLSPVFVSIGTACIDGIAKPGVSRHLQRRRAVKSDGLLLALERPYSQDGPR